MLNIIFFLLLFFFSFIGFILFIEIFHFCSIIRNSNQKILRTRDRSVDKIAQRLFYNTRDRNHSKILP